MNEMRQMIQPWRHVFKLDPDRELGDRELDAICRSGTDAILVGGSTGVTYENTTGLLSRLRSYELPCALEVSELEAAVPGFDVYMIPMVLNTPDTDWILGHHRRAIERFGSLIPWEMVLTEGYIVLNEDSSVARLTNADSRLSGRAAAAYAEIADKLMGLPVVYLEYSGMFGNMDVVREVRESVEHSQLFYGGGITGVAEAEQAAALSDTVVVGNIIYRDVRQALLTVQAVKKTLKTTI
ncbi:putative glycerol-1-phosphate prenyltransferase [Paenibacillus sp. PastF-1]|nr:putative glycerol-1-phosphate prenyltransferase [Paenibacillus sp. PastF-2]MDF9846804.1 putative glycerol-1-phosphate prenyltransferase [Paenibacillus sp. PastM-2]MDF9852847.1 putative glycerol-1-phosphate prenyltransferase [Paenibacillus sp. PastF-1]MDH6478648.1 putative glycerol-1-phosphate prenyltransferase [Paenibacillus sp. PastH-2]MDH6505854.1 putative glycerol-1-phosphate prenyltransferase [Paenibacillus sp. PastM-3]